MKKLLFVGAIFTASIGFSQVPTNGLVGYWPFNGNASDESSNSNNGTVNGATLTSDRFGNSNCAYSFDGVDDVINVTGLNSSSNTWTLSFWFNSENTSSFEMQNVIGLGSSPASYGGAGVQINGGIAPGQCPIFNTNSNKISLLDASQTCGQTIFSNTYSNNSWYNIVIANENGDYKIYVNGILSSSGTMNNISVDKLFFGNRDGISFQWFKGKLDDIRFYNVVLDSESIQNLNYENICKATVQDTLSIYLSQIITTVYDKTSAATTVKVYPNPTDKNLTVSIDNPSNLNGVTLKVIDSQSAVVHNQAVTTATQTIDVSSWSAGIYFLQVINGSNIVDIRKIVVNN